MLNRRLPRLALMLALAALPALSHALACKENGRDGLLITEDIGSTVAVPVTLGEGEIIWHPASVLSACPAIRTTTDSVMPRMCFSTRIRVITARRKG